MAAAVPPGPEWLRRGRRTRVPRDPRSMSTVLRCERGSPLCLNGSIRESMPGWAASTSSAMPSARNWCAGNWLSTFPRRMGRFGSSTQAAGRVPRRSAWPGSATRWSASTSPTPFSTRHGTWPPTKPKTYTGGCASPPVTCWPSGRITPTGTTWCAVTGSPCTSPHCPMPPSPWPERVVPAV